MHNNVVTLQVSTKSIARLMGKGGSNINQLRDDSGAQIDVEKESDGADKTTITLKGTKSSISQARKAIEAIVAEIEREKEAGTLNFLNLANMWTDNVPIRGGAEALPACCDRGGASSDVAGSGWLWAVRLPTLSIVLYPISWTSIQLPYCFVRLTI